MNYYSAIWSALENLRGWVSTSLLGIIAWVVVKGSAIALKNQIENRQLAMEERKLKAAERKQEREGYGPLLTHITAELERMTGQHHACEERMTRLEGELAGYRRQTLEQSVRGFANVPATVTKE